VIRKPLAAAATLAVVGLLAACGDDDTESSDTTAPPRAVAEAPERIVSISPTATEMLFAIGAGGQVVAVDDYSNFPPEAPMTDLSANEPNVEAIASYDPDLVVASDDELESSLAELGIDVVVAPAAEEVEDVYEQLVDLGRATGHVEEAEDLADDIRLELKALEAQLPERDEPLTYYHELDSSLYSVTSGTFIGALYERAGLENVADAADAEGQSGGYPQLSAEYLVEADPDLVFLADTKCCAQTLDTFAGRPGFSELSAVREGRVVLLDDDIASRWGPRIVDFFRMIVETVKAVPAG
jgi:iron complex transport system substrate-binding protein